MRDDNHTQETKRWLELYIRGTDGAESRQLRDSVPPRLHAWIDDALRELRNEGRIQCLTIAGQRIWRLR